MTNILPCVVGGETFCFDAAGVQAVEGVEHVQRNPGPGQPHGWLLNRSDEIEVYDLAELLGFERPSREIGHGFVLVIDAQPAPFGLAVDQVLEQRSLSPGDQVPIPLWVQNRRAGFFSGAVRHEGSLCLNVTPERLHPEALPFLPDPLPPPIRRSAESDPKTLNPAQMLLFTCGTHSAGFQRVYGLSTRQVVEVHEMPRLTPVPTSPPFLRGLTNYRGEAIPVVDLDRFLAPEASRPDAPSRPGDHQLLVVRPSGGAGFNNTATPSPGWVGFPIARQVRVVDLPLACHPAAPDASLARRVRGVFTVENLTLIVPDVDAIPARA